LARSSFSSNASKRLVQNLADITGRERMAEEILKAPQLVVRLLADRHLEGESLWRQWGDLAWLR